MTAAAVLAHLHTTPHTANGERTRWVTWQGGTVPGVGGVASSSLPLSVDAALLLLLLMFTSFAFVTAPIFIQLIINYLMYSQLMYVLQL